MTDVYENIQAGKYENIAKYPIGSSKDPAIAAERRAYSEHQRAIDEMFYIDICEDLGLDPSKESSQKVFSKAYDDGHAYGYTEVYSKMVDLVEFVGEVTALLQKGD